MKKIENIINLIDENALVKDCEYLKGIPETGFELDKTQKYVQGALEDMGIEYSVCGKCGITAVLGNGEETLLLRADMDALSTQNGPAHLCGHHMHTAMLLGAARVLKTMENELRCRVKLMFQPAEEILSGAKDMINSGVLESPGVDKAFMLHVMTASEYETGTFIFAYQGEIAPSADYFDIVVSGRASHGAEPSLGRDSINAGAHIICALQSLNSRELPLSEQGVITIGSIHGGEAANAIAGQLKMSGTMRMYSEETRNFVKNRMSEISSSVAKALRTDAEVIYTQGCPSFLNDKQVLEEALQKAEYLFGKDKVVRLPQGQRGGGSEDFAYVSRAVPTSMALLCAGRKDEGYDYPLHHPDVKFDKKALSYGTALLVGMAVL